VLAYRPTSRPVDAAAAIESLVERAIGSSPLGHDALRALLIDAGMLESGLLDAEAPVADDRSRLATTLDATMSALADVFVRSWGGATITSSPDARRALDELRSLAPNEAIELTVPEGFAYYGLFPETYVGAARAIAGRYEPERALVIGIRSIGTTLSAVVAAALRERGIATKRLTVRPRGHPFDRELRLSSALTSELTEHARDARTLFVIVDEGPGLSGSSFASVAETLVGLGASGERIVLAPSWDPPASALSSTRGQRCWTRHARFVGDFERDWIASGRLARRFGVEIISDLSAGAWRSRCYQSPSAYPPVQPQHERRKLLARVPAAGHVLLKFEGLGSLGIPRRDRAMRLADAGFGPPVRDFADGFLATPWIDGRPMHAQDVDAEFVEHLGRYLAWLRCREQTGEPAEPDALRAMVEVNVEEGLGAEWTAPLRRVDVGDFDGEPAIRVDGRMLPHEWLRTSRGYTKTDALAHHDDHFYPGATDIAWDVAGACVELELDPEAERALIRAYRERSGDRTIATRLPFYRRAYLAFRLGYATLAEQALGESPDASGMRGAARRYAGLLRHQLSKDVAELKDNAEHGQSYVTDT
jgi:hypothetical protein